MSWLDLSGLRHPGRAPDGLIRARGDTYLFSREANRRTLHSSCSPRYIYTSRGTDSLELVLVMMVPEMELEQVYQAALQRRCSWELPVPFLAAAAPANWCGMVLHYSRA